MFNFYLGIKIKVVFQKSLKRTYLDSLNTSSPESSQLTGKKNQWTLKDQEHKLACHFYQFIYFHIEEL